MDLVRGFDSDEDVDLVPSDDDSGKPIVPPPKSRGGISWRGLQDGFSSSDDEARPARPAAPAALGIPAPAKSSWSFREAIDRIDASSSRTFHGTTLKEKVAAATKSTRGAHTVPMNRSKAGEDEAEEGGDEAGEDEGADDDDDEEDGDDEDDSDDDESDAADDADDGTTEPEDDDAEAAEEALHGKPSAKPAASVGAPRPVPRTDDVADMLAAARPNPLRAKGGGAGSSGGGDATASGRAAELEAQYQSFFSPDPFSERAMPPDAEGTVAAGSKRRREAAAAAEAGAGSGADAGSAAAVPVPLAFTDMNLSRPLLRAVAALGYTSPTPIQCRVIPLALAGHDVCGSAVTGSGKTAAYLLPILERLLFKPSRSAAIRVLILTPTRELATQVHSMAAQLGQYCPDIRAALIVGGLSLKHQEADLRGRPDIVVATPGRMLDHIRNSLAVHCDDVDVLVLDEADRLLEMGFEDEVTEVVRACPIGRQTLLFSATMTARVETLVKLSLRKPVRVTADPLFDMAKRLVQEFVRIKAGREEDDREALLLALATRSFTGGGVLIFAVHKHTAHRLAVLLTLAGLSVAELHGNLTQRQRLSALEDFREARVDYLVATDLAGRGLDIAGVRCVINFEMPRELTAYVHRVGRTARAGRAGVAVTLVSEGQRSLMRDVVRHAAMNVRSRVIAPEVVAQWRQWLVDQIPAIEAVHAAEREEREMRLAEVDAARAGNLLDHGEEIRARPARTWFQTEREKDAVRKAAAEATADGAAPGEGGGGAKPAAGGAGKKDKPAKAAAAAVGTHRLNRRKRRRLEASAALDAEERRIRRMEAEGAREVEGRPASGGGRRGSDAKGGGSGASSAPFKLDKATLRVKRAIEATRHVHAAAKATKAEVRDRAVASGLPVSAVQRLVHKSKKQHRGASAAGGKKRGGGSFEADDASGGDGAGAGDRSGASASGRRGSKAGPSSAQVGRKAFKSKARFKRR